MSSTNNNSQVGYQWKPTTKKVVKQQRKDFSEDNSNDDTGISLCIRFVFKNINPGRVFNVMKNPTIILENGQNHATLEKSLGFIERIDHIIRRDGNKTYFLHFRPKSWNFDNLEAADALETMKTGQAIKIVNDDHGHFWKVTISKAQRPEDASQHNLENKLEQKLTDESDDEEFDVYQEGPFAMDYNDFPDIKNEVANEIAELTVQKEEEKTSEI